MPEYLLPSEIVRHRVAQLRREQDISQEMLAALMNDQGWTWVRSTVAKVEAGGPKGRQVSIDEMVSLAFVLGVPPIALLIPTARADVKLTPTTSASSEEVWRWMAGDLVPTVPFGIIGESELEDRIDEVLALQRRYDEACPDYVVNAEREIPGLRYLAQLIADVQYVAGSAAHAGPRERKRAHKSIVDLVHRIRWRADRLIESEGSS